MNYSQLLEFLQQLSDIFTRTNGDLRDDSFVSMFYEYVIRLECANGSCKLDEKYLGERLENWRKDCATRIRLDQKMLKQGLVEVRIQSEEPVEIRNIIRYFFKGPPGAAHHSSISTHHPYSNPSILTSNPSLPD